MSREWSECSTSCGKDGLRHQLYDCESVESKIPEYRNFLILSMGEPSGATGGPDPLEKSQLVMVSIGISNMTHLKRPPHAFVLPDELGPPDKYFWSCL